jgi:pectate lyase
MQKRHTPSGFIPLLFLLGMLVSGCLTGQDLRAVEPQAGRAPSAQARAASPAVKAFPSAEGFGAADTKGGRGGRVIEVTNLKDGGPGSFRACAEATGPRFCVFRVGGVITLNSPINITAGNSFVTIAGQTAPGAGITLTPWPINISYGAHDVILRHVRHRQGYTSMPADGNNACGGIIVYGPGKIRTHHVIIDHASVAWACDDSTQASGYVTDITFQWSIIGEGYEGAKGDPYGGSKGFIVGGNQDEAAQNTVSFHHNMLLQSGTRNPGGGPIKTLDWRYNVIYNWFACTGNFRLGGTDENIPTTKPAHHNFVGNKYIPGPDTAQDFSPAGCWLGELREEAQTKVYVQDNETPWCGNTACPADTFALGWGNGTTGGYPAEEARFRAREPFPAPAITPTSRATLEAVLSKQAGATVPLRDALDTRLVSELAARGGHIGRRGESFPSLANSAAGLAEKDTDKDGMPDAWEVAHRLNANDASDGPKVASNGYTNVENYLNELAGDTIPPGLAGLLPLHQQRRLAQPSER